MTQFNPQGKSLLTYAECLDPAMKITDKQDAEQYLKAYIEYLQKHLDTEPHEEGYTAEQIAKINIGYYAGYYGQEVMARVQQLFGIEKVGPAACIQNKEDADYFKC